MSIASQTGNQATDLGPNVSDTPNEVVLSELNSEDQPPLMPERYLNHDLFICDVGDAILKDIIPQMEHPFYSLTKKPEHATRRYEHNGNWLEVIPSGKGQATIYDKDILIYAISQLFTKLNRGEKVSKRVHLNSYDLLIFTNRGTGGKDYKALVEALQRLRGTTITTNINTEAKETSTTFGLIEQAIVERERGNDGRLLSCEITLSDWVFAAIEDRKALTLHRDYFRLRKPIERRLYELARKHCGQKDTWSCFLETLYKKSGSQGSLREFRRKIKNVAETNHLPDYTVQHDEKTDKVIFVNKNTPAYAEINATDDDSELPALEPATYEAAKRAAPEADVYALEQDWRSLWQLSGKPLLNNPQGAFIKFCQMKAKQTPK